MKNILIIEQDSAITALLKTALSSSNSFVLSVQSGEAALMLLAERPFDVVIIDIISPKFDNCEVILKINEMQRRPRLIAMTGYSGNQNREYLSKMAEAMSIERLLFKPFILDELQKLVFQDEESNQAGFVD
ncbi:MAG: response regulator [Desulfuromonadaceae bacterium]|nr:response regulator [Desulfuromonadaceae bacterium]